MHFFIEKYMFDIKYMSYNIIIIVIFLMILFIYNFGNLKFKKIYKLFLEKVNLITTLQLKMLNKKRKNKSEKKRNNVIKHNKKNVKDHNNDDEVLQHLLQNKSKYIGDEIANDELSEMSSLDIQSINSNNSDDESNKSLLSFK